MASGSHRAGLAVLVLGGAAALAVAVLHAQQPAEGPVAVAWDRERCAHCRMLVSERGFAGQLHTTAGAVHYFDDPGCLLLWSSSHAEAIRGIWLHHLEQERWIAADDVVFVSIEPTPMGYGLGARVRGEAQGLTLEEGRHAVLEHERRRADGEFELGTP